MNETNDTNSTDDSEQLPDRLSVDPSSPYYNEAVLARDVGIRFKGAEKTNVEEYCISEGWVRVTAGNAKDRHGNPLTIKVHGPVEPYYRDKANPGVHRPVIARSEATKQSILPLVMTHGLLRFARNDGARRFHNDCESPTPCPCASSTSAKSQSRSPRRSATPISISAR